ncbi:MAG: hypothetical protein V9G12_17190 [Microthrixaceae bacterium]
MTTELRVTAMDHIVLKCRDIEATLAWYLGELGLSPVRIDEWRAGDAPFPSVRVSADTIIDLVAVPADQDPKNDRLDHVCLVIEPTDLDAARSERPIRCRRRAWQALRRPRQRHVALRTRP